MVLKGRKNCYDLRFFLTFFCILQGVYDKILKIDNSRIVCFQENMISFYTINV